MRTKRNAPERLAYHFGSKSKSQVRFYTRKLKNAMIKGSALGSFLTIFYGAGMVEAEVPGGFTIMMVATAYLALWTGVNYEYLERL